MFLFEGMAQPVLKFEKEKHDFGQVEEAAGPIEHSFLFVNSGNQPIKIQSVKASCGCTTPGWTKEEIQPGDSGFVKAKYNPSNRPGRFSKTLRLTTTSSSQNKVLYISGYVKPKPKSLEEEYPIKIGGLSFKNQYLNFGKITTEKPQSRILEVYNNTDSSYSLIEQINIPDYLELSLNPGVIESKQKGELIITYDPKAKNDFGLVSDKISFEGGKGITVIATIEEHFPEMTAEQLDRAPKLSINSRLYEFGTVQEGEIISMNFRLKNIGVEKLSFRKIKSSCDCITFEFIDRRIKKGKEENLNVKFDTSGLKGNQHKTISVYSNDPVLPTQVISIKGKISDK